MSGDFYSMIPIHEGVLWRTLRYLQFSLDEKGGQHMGIEALMNDIQNSIEVFSPKEQSNEEVAVYFADDAALKDAVLSRYNELVDREIINKTPGGIAYTVDFDILYELLRRQGYRATKQSVHQALMNESKHKGRCHPIPGKSRRKEEDFYRNTLF